MSPGNCCLRHGVSLNMPVSKVSENLLQGAAAPFAGLFLVAALFSAALRLPVRRSPSQIAPPSSRTGHVRRRPTRCDSFRTRRGGVAHKNIGAQRTPAAVTEIMADRPERAVFLLPGQDASVREVADLVTRLNNAVSGLFIGVVTYTQQNDADWPNRPFGNAVVGCMAFPATAQ